MAKKSKKPPAKKPTLSELENKVMDVVWRQREVNAEQVRRLVKSNQPLTDSTIRTVLRRLEAKGYVSHRREGRLYLYQPTDFSQNVAADAVRGIIDRFCDGSVESLLVGMVNREVVTPEKLRELADRIKTDQQKRKGNKK
ncbi:BlaI/MecI/CopY family transcriptional regulator [Stieleria varia]|uniref:Penicillinase repressor n=1 Tax=Stieleria varia TaxID=2528005 RepID=A0A5C6AGI9_9BACT|nr:BlaI/MecI/CopY family transcriptional regulator [Stieleria varia]TWT98305.1 Penicillinase repressor [Stieleria varia]